MSEGLADRMMVCRDEGKKHLERYLDEDCRLR